MLKTQIKNGVIEAIWDDRYGTPVDITDGTGRFGCLAYTLHSQDINKAVTPDCIPFPEQYAGYGPDLSNETFETTLLIEENAESLILELRCGSEQVDGTGIFLPFNFISRKNGFWQNQFTISSPYCTQDRAHYFYYLQRPDGKNLVCVVENEIDCYQVNYSPYLAGHFIRGITFWSQTDRAFGRPERKNRYIRVHLVPVSSYCQAMEAAGTIWNMPGAFYKVSGVKAGNVFAFDVIGQWDEIHIVSPSGVKTVSKELSFTPGEYGCHKIIPYKNGKPGMDCTMFCYDDLQAMHERACQSIVQDRSQIIGTAQDGTPVYKPPFASYRGCEDFNLCEHAMWSWSALKYLLRGNSDERLSGDVKNLLRIMDPENHIDLERSTFDPKNHYSTVSDNRIQEAYNGVSILLSAYRYYGEERLLELAITVLSSRLEADMHDDGGLYRHGSDGATAETADYTTVTCLVMPVVDMALLLQEKNDPRADAFKAAAIRIADHIASRGLNFPTEGGVHEEVNPEVEEGSMSCAVLTVMYVGAKLGCKPEYLEFAGNVLACHDAFTVHTPHPCMFRSSLRWWETVWEGDSDGPAVCFGHGWSIWRAEAEFLYSLLVCDDARLLDSWNCLMTNLSKTDKDGNMYAICQYEAISSGAVTHDGSLMDRSDRMGFPHRKDRTLSRFAYARASDTWFETVAILPGHILGADEIGGVIVPYFGNIRQLYVGDVEGTYRVDLPDTVKIVSSKRTCLKDGILTVSAG